MENITLALALLLGVGFVVAKVGQLIRLPSVTGYIFAGILLGSSGFNLISAHAVGLQLGHFTQIALMLIAFGIGEHLEISRLRASLRTVSIIGVCEIIVTFALVSVGAFFIATVTGLGAVEWTSRQYVVLSVLLGAVSVATAPAAIMHVIRELRAAGPLTTSLMAVVATDNGLAIMLFGFAMALARNVMAAGGGAVLPTLSMALIEIAGSLLVGVLTGLLIDFVNGRLRQKDEMLTGGLALLLLCGEGARMFGLSPLLAGMAAGFTIVNRAHRDIRLFRALNAFEAPIYVLFFTLAGVHFDFSALRIAGWLGLGYFGLRTFGKIIGAGIGARLSRAPKVVQHYLGFSLTPQAGVAIGLLFLINDDPAVQGFAEFITPVVLTGVVLSELIGPVCVRFSLIRAEEALLEEKNPDKAGRDNQALQSLMEAGPPGVPMVPWTWEKFDILANPDGVVVFGAGHLGTAAALARLSTIIANFYNAFPLAARIMPLREEYTSVQREAENTLMSVVKTEVSTMGSELYSMWQESDDVAEGILDVARQTQAQTCAIVLGLTLQVDPINFQRIIGKVVEQADCSTVVVKFNGVFHTERILVPIVNMRELYVVRDIIKAFLQLGHQQFTFVRLFPSFERDAAIEKAKKRLTRWIEMEGFVTVSTCKALPTESRQETILQEALEHDLVVMAGSLPQGIRSFLFGSLANKVAQRCAKTLITVYPPSQ